MRGAWIEIALIGATRGGGTSLPVRGAWIEMLNWQTSGQKVDSRSPCGERGLKFEAVFVAIDPLTSLPVRGAWIEIWRERQASRVRHVAPRAGSVD